MNYFKCESIKILSIDESSRYTDMTFDGCFFYFPSVNACSVDQYNECFDKIGSISTDRIYSHLCYDGHERCFWAVTKKTSFKLYKLDKNLRQLDCISFCMNEESEDRVTGLSYNYYDHTLLIASTSYIMRILKRDFTLEIVQRAYKTCYTSVVSIGNGFITTNMRNWKQRISILDGHEKLKNTFDLPNEYHIESIILYPYLNCCNEEYQFFLLATNNEGCSCLLKWVVDSCELGIKICKCNFISCDKKCCDKCCNGRTPQPCLNNSCNRAIECIALISAAIAHILNAEGEKIQKIVAVSNDINEILCVNKMVNETIVNVTHLEHTLYDKLGVIRECCNNLCEEECCDQKQNDAQC